MINQCTTKKARLYNGGKTVSSINGAGKTGQLYVKNETRILLTQKYSK